jgi:hypothetical protein
VDGGAGWGLGFLSEASMKPILIQILNPNAILQLLELEKLGLIKVLNNEVVPDKKKNYRTKLSEKFRGVLTKKEAERFMEHTRRMRSEWD